MSDDEDLYDEFGNYIGPALESSSEDESSQEDDEEDEIDEVSSVEPDRMEEEEGDNEHTTRTTTSSSSTAIVLHEDKVHYPSAEKVFGEHVRTVILDEDAMELEEPIIQPIKTKIFSFSDEAASSDIYLTSSLLSNPTTETRRGVAVCGHLYSGKTSLMDMLLHPSDYYSTNNNNKSTTASSSTNTKSSPRLTDTLLSEQERQLSLKSTPCTLALPDSRGKHYAITMIDCPGHVDFHDETVAALRIVDGVLLVVDVLEGAHMMHVPMILKQALVVEGIHVVLLLNKIDRLILDLKLPPDDAYYKILHVIDCINAIIIEINNNMSKNNVLPTPYFAPEKGNVVFASTQHGWSFTLETMAQHYADHNLWKSWGGNNSTSNNNNNLGQNLTVQEFAKRLWGDCYLDEGTRMFHRYARDCTTTNIETKRTFVQFILEPLYKIYAICIGEEEEIVQKIIRNELGVQLKHVKGSSCARPILREACQQFFGIANTAGLVDTIVRTIPSPKKAARGKISRTYTGSILSNVGQSMVQCNAKGPLMVHIVKLYSSSSSPDGSSSFAAFGRIYSGTLKSGDTIQVLGEAYSYLEDEEDVMTATVSSIYIPKGRAKVQVQCATAGNWILIEGIDFAIARTATLVDFHNNSNNDTNEEEGVHIFKPLSFPQCGFESTIKLAVEPLNPADLPKMVEGLRRITKSYPMAKTRVEESGEHVLFGTGELYLDCIMHDLRHFYSQDIEIKVADPAVAFRETVVDTSSLQCFADTPNKRNTLTFIAEPLSGEGLAEKLEAGKVDIVHWDNKKLGRYFQTQYDWDLLSSRSVWAFGPSPTHGTNILLDDTLPSEVDKNLLQTCKSSIVQGFQWAVREGPLCEEPIRSTQIKLLNVSLADQPIHRGGGQIIPTARRTVHSAILTATPRIMEPVYQLQIQCNNLSIVDAIQPLISKRRGHVVQDKAIAGTAISIVKAFMPVIDSFGFETDLRTFTQGQAMVHSVLDHWAIVPGDPMDSSIVLHPLEPSPIQHLAREFIIKTRRRKGLPEDVSMNRFFDEKMKALLLAQQKQQQEEEG